MKTNNTRTIESYRQKQSKLTQSQILTETKEYFENGDKYKITVTVRYDDQCNNGHNDFAITGEINRKGKNNHWLEDSCGCIHEEIAKHFPELIPFFKWHLVSSDEPMHYIANALYWAGYTKYKDAKNEENLKSTIVYGALETDHKFNLMKASKEELTSFLNNRLPDLRKAFRNAVESLGFVY